MHILDAFRDTPIRFTAINGIKVKKEKEESKHPLSVRGSEPAAMCLERKLIEKPPQGTPRERISVKCPVLPHSAQLFGFVDVLNEE